MAASFYWHDYETWGADPARDRPCQFAGLRSDADLNPIGEPLVAFCRPADDLLPHPDACLVTGITPQRAARAGLCESDFAAAIQQALATPGTCGVGFNSLHFDDEVTRYLFYRNLLDPYAHAWQHGNTRFDLIDALRLAHALRPNGITWPEREPGVASFKLTDLTAANDIPHVGAHDALADVQATLALARRLRAAQPRLFAYALTLRDQRLVRDQLDQARANGTPLLHCSQRYPAAAGCIAPVITVAPKPGNPKAVLCFDLRQDPALLFDLSVEELRLRLFTPVAELPAGVERIGIKGVKVNAVPMLAPMSTLTPAAAERWAIDPDLAARRAAMLAGARPELTAKLAQVFSRDANRADPGDPDLMLYDGFIGDADRRVLNQLRTLAPSELAGHLPRLEDPRLPTLVFRWRARNWPDTLDEAEREDWDGWRFERLTDPAVSGALTIDAFEQRLAELRAERADDADTQALLDELEAWAAQVMDACD